MKVNMMVKTHCFDRKKSANIPTRRVAHDSGFAFLHSPAQEQIRECLAAPRVQAKLAISAPSDPCEQEADRIAERMVETPGYRQDVSLTDGLLRGVEGNSPIYRKVYSNEKYTVDINEDGSILVKKDDWLSKYSAAMHGGDFSHIEEFVRISDDGKEKKIENPDQLTEGETIYHFPTYSNFRNKTADKKNDTTLPNEKPDAIVGEPAVNDMDLDPKNPNKYSNKLKIDFPPFVDQPNLLESIIGKPELKLRTPFEEKQVQDTIRLGLGDPPGKMELSLSNDMLKKLFPGLAKPLERLNF